MKQYTQQLTQSQQTKNEEDYFGILESVEEKHNLPKLSKEQRREMNILMSMGLKNYEIQYLVHLKKKEKSRQKWIKY